jgi:hypothetical protein
VSATARHLTAWITGPDDQRATPAQRHCTDAHFQRTIEQRESR